MPIYEYRCESCGHTLDVLQKVSDEPLADCPECRDPALKKLVSAPSFRLKGSGWYETDFKSDKEKKRNLADGADKKAGDDKPAATDSAKSSGDAKSSDAKPAAKKTEKSSGGGSEAA